MKETRSKKSRDTAPLMHMGSTVVQAHRFWLRAVLKSPIPVIIQLRAVKF